MGRRQRAVSTAIVAAVVVVIVAVAGGYLAYDSLPQTTRGSSTSSEGASTTSLTPTNSRTWTVITSNTTLYYGQACRPVGLFALSCPTMNTAMHSPSLSNVEIISYQGKELYDMNFTFYSNGQPVTHTVWFTNETIFCVSPMFEGNNVCPVHPIEHVITIATPASSATNPTNNLRLELHLSTNSTGGIHVTVDEHNTLNRVNNVTVASNWAIPANTLRDICDNYVAAYAVYQGNYGVSNFTKVTPLVLETPGAGSICPAPSPSAVYSFGPDSGVASGQAGIFSPVATSRNVTLSDSISGYFTCGTNAPSFKPQNGSGLWTCGASAAKFNPFPPGTYTVVALDQWGDVAVVHFEAYS